MAQVTKITTEEFEFDTEGRTAKKTTTEKVAVTELDEHVVEQLMGAVEDRTNLLLKDFMKQNPRG